jgi:hypothetical protein
MNVDIEEITFEGEIQYKLRIDGVLHGVFWTWVDVEQHADDLRFNWPDAALKTDIKTVPMNPLFRVLGTGQPRFVKAAFP